MGHWSADELLDSRGETSGVRDSCPSMGDPSAGIYQNQGWNGDDPIPTRHIGTGVGKHRDGKVPIVGSIQERIRGWLA